MKVLGRVEITPGEECRLKHCVQVHHAILELETQKIYPKPLKPTEVTASLYAEKYEGELISAGIDILCHSTETQEVVVLQGRPVVPGRPARYRQVTVPQVFDPIRRRRRIATVPIGATVATLEPEIPGVPGVDVFGNEVPCPAHRPLPQLGSGVIELNGRVVSVRNGRLVFTKSHIDVVPELVFSRDVSSKDGKIEFDGDVIVWGSVLDGSSIQATGRVEVRGGVLCSDVLGERGVHVTAAIVGSKVIAGQSRLLHKDIYSTVKRCLQHLDRFMSEYKALTESAQKRTNGKRRLTLLADVLLTERHEGLERVLMYLSEDSERLAEIDDGYRKLVLELRAKWTGIGRTNLTQHDVDRLKRLLEEYVLHVEDMMSSGLAEVRAASVTSSSVRATGNVFITGAGVHASTIEAGNSLLIKGIVRGGFLMAKNAVHCRELGTPSGTETSVKVTNPSGKVAVRVRHPNTLLQVGGRRNRNQVAEYNVVFQSGDV